MVKKYSFTFVLSLLLSFSMYATHIVGGALTYVYNGNNSYTVSLVLYRDCAGNAYPASVTIQVQQADGSEFSPSRDIVGIAGGIATNVPYSLDSCAVAPSPIPCVQMRTYSTTVTLPAVSGGYHLYYQLCCRNVSLSNINTSAQTNPGDGESFYAFIPGTAVWNEDFTLANGTTVDAGTTAWTRTLGTTPPAAAAVNTNQFEFQGANNAQATWTSQVINISSLTSGANLSMNLLESGNLDANDSMFVYYSLNGGPLILFSTNGTRVDDFVTATASQNGLIGSTVQITVRVHYDASSPSSETYQFDNVLVYNSVSNTTPVYTAFPPLFLCAGNAFTFDHSAIDADGDSLFYSFYTPYRDLAPTFPGSIATFTGFTYNAGYSASSPLNAGGPALSLNSSTGLLSGTPNTIGQFQVGIKTTEYRSGVKVSDMVRDFQFNIISCPAPAQALITPTGALSVCSGSTLTFPNNSDAAATNWTWNFGDLTTTLDVSTLQYPTYTYPGPGSYTARLIINAGTSCADTSTAIITVATPPASPTAGNNGPLCIGATLNLTASTVTGATYSWTGPNSFTSTLQNPSIASTTALAAGTYSVTATVSGCTGAPGTTTVVINSFPVAPSASSNSAVCAGSPLNLFAATITGATYAWTGPNSFTSALQNPSIASPTTLAAGTYSVTATVSGCTGPAGTTVVVVNPAPIAPTAGSNSPVCVGSPLNLTASSISGATYAWTGPNSFTSALQNPSIASTTLLAAGTYSVIATVSGCPGPAGTTTVIVNNIPSAPTAAGTTICTGTSAALTASVSGGTYEWYDAASGGTLLFSGATYTTPVLTTTTTYYVQSSVGGCAGPRTAVTVTVSPVPASPTAPSTAICTGTSTTLTATAPGGTYQWYDAASGGTLLATAASYTTPVLTATTTYYVQTTVAGCTGSRTAVTVTVSPVPAAPTAAAASICSGGTATLTATAPGGTYEWFNAASGGMLLATAASYTTPALTATTTYYVQTTIGGCTGPRTAVTVTVNTIPVAPTAVGTTICAGNTATLTATAPGGTYEWYTASTGGTILATGSSYTTPALAATTTYYVQSTVGVCTGPRTAVTVTVTPTPLAPTAAGTSICTGTTATITASAPGGTYQWYDAATGGTLLATAASYTTPVLTTTTTYYVQTTVAGCAGPRTAVTVTVSPVPAAPTAAAASICSGSTATLTATAPGGTYQWYSAATGGTLLATAASYTTPVLTATTTYYVQTTVAGCAGPRTAVTVTVNPIPVAPTAAGITICAGNTGTITATAPGGTYEWYSAATGGTLLATAASYTTSALAVTTTYYVQTTIGGCTGPRTAVTVTVNPIPVAPTATGTTICSGSTSTITATAPGGAYQWYDAATGGTLLVSTAAYTTPVLTATTTYYVQTTVGGCTGPRTAVTVTVNPIPAAPTAAGTIICESTTATITATAPGGTYQWHDAATGGTLLITAAAYTTPVLTATTTYYVQTTVGGCTGPRTAVTVTVTPTPAAPTATGTTICSGSTATISATAPGGSYEWYSAASGGILLATATSFTTPVLTTTTTYYVQTTVSGCTGPRTAVTVTANPIPAAPTALSPTICSGSTATVTATAPGGAYQWYDAATGGTLLASTAAYTTPALTATTTYYVQTTVGGCTGPRTAVTVTVNPIPLAPTAVGTTICQGTSATLSATAPGGTYNWFVAPTGGTTLFTGANYTTPILSVTTTYYVQTTVGGCISPRSAVTVTVTPTPAAPTAAGITICEGNSTTLTATAPGGTYEWYDAATGGTLLATAASFTTPVLTATTSYYVQTTLSGCTGPRTIVTVTVTPTDDASFSYATGTYCVTGTNPTATITGGFAGTFSAVPAGLVFTSTSTGNINLAASALNTYTVTFTTSGPCPTSSTVNITITNAPSALFTYSTPYCQSDANPLPTFNPGASAGMFSATPAGIIFVSTSTGEIDMAASTAGTYTVTNNIVAAGGCAAATASSTITINLNPLVGAGSNQTICEGTTAVMAGTMGGSTTSVTWSGGTGSFSPAGSLTSVYTAGTGETTAVLIVTTNDPAGPCTSITDTAIITITPTPAAPTAAGTTICEGTTATLTATAPGGTYQWYNATTGGTLLATAATFTTPALTITTTYYVQTTVAGCASPRTAVTVTVTPTPAAPTATGTTICSGSTATITATAPGGTYEWYDAATGGTLLASTAAYTTPALTSTTTYYVQTTVSGCTGPRTAVTVTANPIPLAPTATSPTICTGSAATITATTPGGTYQWYDAASGGTLLASTAAYTTPALTATTSYYVQATVGGCPGPMTTVTVTVNPIPVAPTAVGTTICQGTSTTLSATAPGGTYRWYPVPTGGTLLFTGANYTTPALSVTTTYYVQTTVGGCTSPRTAVTVTVTPTPAAPTASSTTICEGNSTTLTATAPGGTYEWYDAATGGTLLATNASYITPVLTATTSYYVQTTLSGCSSPRTIVTVTVTPTDDATFSYSSGTYCFTGTNPLPIFTGGVSGTFSSSPTGLVFVSSSTGEINLSASALATYSVTFTTSGSCTSSSTVNVTVTNAPSAAFTYSTPYCSDDSNPLPSFSAGASAGVFSASPAGLTFLNATTGEVDLLTTTTGTYTITNDIAAAGGCAAATSSSTVTINPAATVNAGTDQTICGSSTVNLSGTIGGSATGASWTGGTGTFSNSSILNPVYTPGPGETSATLTLTSNDPAGPCTSMSDVMVITINPIPVAPTAAAVTICQGTTATLTATAPGGTYQWFAAATGGTALASGTSYTSPVLVASTTYYVQTTVGGCTSTRTAVTVTVTPTENAAFSYSSGTFCITGTNPVAVIAGGTSGTFTSTPAGLVFINASTGEIDLPASALNTYTVTFTTSGICSGNSSVNVTITTAPDATFSYGGPYCPGGTNPTPTFPTGASAGVFSASMAGINFVNASTGEINLSTSTPGTYTITNDISASGGCAAATASATLVIDIAPTVSAGPDQTVCSGTAVTLAGSIGGSASSGIWSGGTGTFSLNTDLNAVYTPATGETTATLTLTTNDPAGTCIAVANSMSIIFQLDSSSFSYSPSTYCVSGTNPIPVVIGGYTGTFSSSPAGLVFVSTSTGEINLSASALNTYTITFTSSGTCPNMTSSNLTITNGLDATFSYAGPFCQSGTNPLPVLAAGANAGVFSAVPAGLNFANTATGEIDLSTTLPGTYAITNFIAAAGGCASATASSTVSIDSAATVNAGSDRSICVGSTVTLAGTIGGTATSATWSGGSGTFSSNTALNALYTPATGETSALLILTSNDPTGPCGSDIDSMIVTINPFPIAPVVSDTSICYGAAATLTATAPGGTYEWYDAATGGTLLITGSTYTSPFLTANTIYYVQTTVAGCTGPQTPVTVTVNPEAIVDAGANQVICANNTLVTLAGTITNASGGTWSSSGTGTFSPNDTSLNATYMPGSAEVLSGSAMLFLISNGPCAAVADTMLINFSPAPVVDAGINQFICTGTNMASLNGTVSGGASTGQWTTLGSGTFSANDTILNATYNLSTADTIAGSVTLILTSTNNASCVAVSDTMLITITTIPVPNAGNDTTVCGNNADIQLNGTVTGGSGQGVWTSNGTGTFTPSDSVLNAVYNPSATDIASGNIVLMLSPINACLIQSDSILVTITTPPVVNAGPDTTVCGGGAAIALSGTVDAVASGGLWTSTGSGTFSPNDSTLNATYIPASTDNDTLVFVLTSYGNGLCNAVTDTVVIIQNAPLSAGFSASNLCIGQAVSFTDTSNANGGTITSWAWSFGSGGNTATIQNPTFSYPADGNYSVTLIISSASGCVDSITQSITVNPIPTADYTPSGGTFNVNQIISFTNQSAGGSTYVWDFDDGTATSILTDPSHGFAATGTYVVVLTATNSFGCSDTVAYDFVIATTGSAVPTGFTPDNDGLNDYFYVIGNFSSYELRVFNEWGNEIFISNDQANKWDGTYKGKQQPAGTYVYIFNGKVIDGEELKMNGEVNLIR
jgi:gliding motility-associated-like protein